MSKVKQVLEIARDELQKTEGKTIPKDQMLGTLDGLIRALPQAQNLDEQQIDIFVTYMNMLNAKMDLLFSATALCGLGLSNDIKTRAIIKDMERKFNTVKAQFERDLTHIINPEEAARLDERDAELRDEVSKRTVNLDEKK